jgi:hypothetical protein
MSVPPNCRLLYKNSISDGYTKQQAPVKEVCLITDTISRRQKALQEENAVLLSFQRKKKVRKQR